MNWRGKLLQQRFRVQRCQGRATRNQSRQQTSDVRRGETAARDFLYCTRKPRNHNVLPGRNKFDEVAWTIKKRRSISARRAPAKVHRNNSRKMSRPLAFHEILVIAGRDDVASAQIRFIDPIFVMQHMIFATTTKAAVENVIPAFQSQPYAFADNQRARPQLVAKHAKTPNLRFRRDFTKNPSDRSSMAENVLALPLHSCQSQSVLNHSQIVHEDEAIQHRMSCLDSRIEYSNFNSAAPPVPQKRTRVIERRPRIQ